MVLRFPSAGSARAAFPNVIGTIRALRRPAPNTGFLIYSVPRPHFLPLSVRSRAAEASAQARSRYKPRHHSLFEMGRSPGLPGSWRIHPIPLPCSSIPAGSPDPHPIGLFDAVPAIPKAKTPARLISELNDTASVSAVYASSDALLHPHARLASGRWLAFAGRASNPLDPNEKFRSATSDLLLSQAYPGATECKSCSQQVWRQAGRWQTSSNEPRCLGGLIPR